MNLYRVTFHYAASTRIASHFIDVRAPNKATAAYEAEAYRNPTLRVRSRVQVELLDNALIEEPRQ